MDAAQPFATGRARPIATYVLLALMVFGFGVTELMGGAVPSVLVRLGANAPVLDQRGQWFRLFTTNFLHGGYLHLYLNGIALLTLGRIVEQLFGTARFLVVVLLSALGGSLASMLNATHAFSVGISTALFGLLGAWAFAVWRFKSNLPAGFHRSRRWWLGQLGINAALSALPTVDWAAHLGGLATGVASTAVLFSGAREFSDRPRVGTRISLFALVALFACALALGVRYAMGPSDWKADEIHAALDLPRAPPELLNSMAWELAVDPKSDPETLRLARDAMDRATARAPTDFQLRDTAATVDHRLGDDGSAVLQECEALRLERASNPACTDCKERRIFQAQLCRFLAAREEGNSERLDVDWLPDGLSIRPPASGPSGLHAYGLLEDEHHRVLLEIEGDVAPPATELKAPPLLVPWPTSSDSPVPSFACVEWGPKRLMPLQATPAELDPSVWWRP